MVRVEEEGKDRKGEIAEKRVISDLNKSTSRQ
jgi:hypothetical protein